MKEKLQKIREEAMHQIEQSADLGKLNDVRVAILGKKGELTAVLKGMKDVSPEERPLVGQLVNETRESIERKLEETKAKLEELSADLLSSDFLKGAIDAGGKLIDILDGIVKSGNAIPTLLTAIGAGLSFKNIGKCYVSA